MSSPISDRDDARFMALAMDEARLAADAGEVPIGAVLVKDGEVIARSGNLNRAKNDPTAHAEILCIRDATEKLNNQRLVGCDLYVTLEPCAMCAGALSFARIRRVVYAAPDPKGGGVEHGGTFFAQPTCHHKPEVKSGLMAEESAVMLRNFFKERRK